jgi:hypothetical protein
MRIRPDPGRIPISSLLTLLFVVLHPASLGAQGLPTASKEAAISFFGTYSRVSTDRSSQKDNGFTVGFAYTRYLHWFLTPSLEVRCKIANGRTVGEKTFGGGIRVEHRFKNFYPYANFFGYQFEHWNVGLRNTFTPQIFSIGVLYRIPFKPYPRE